MVTIDPQGGILDQAKKIFFYLFLSTLVSLLLSGCMNSGTRFMNDVFDTLCCFSPAIILPMGLGLVRMSRTNLR